MATNHQPLLESPPRKKPSSFLKVVGVFLAFAAVLGTISVVSVRSIARNPYFGVCARAHDPASCSTILSGVSGSTKMDDRDLLGKVLQKSMSRLHDTVQMTNDISRRINDEKEQGSLSDCVELMDLSMDRVMDSVAALKSQTARSDLDAHTWLSSVLTNHITCLDGLNEVGRSLLEAQLQESVSIARTALALMAAKSLAKGELIQPLNGEFPPWVTSRDRKLLEAPANAAINANVVVAKDGSGNYKTVKEAVESAPNKGKYRYVIYIKKGIYKEKVEIGKHKKHIMLTGDGMHLTIITGSLNVVDGASTFNSATVAAVGDGFIAQDIWFQNTAGPAKHQAVALRVGADESVINRCRIDAYQDTLYTHSLRQFYRDCQITGTVDFIFGDAAVVFQKCRIVARKPMDKQKNMVTAQGRSDPNQNTGTSIQKCDVIASPDLEPKKKSIHTYLGRPWKEYSRTVFLQSHMGDHIHPSGWSPWSGDFALKTLYYGEYENWGPGAGTNKRVKWPGYHVIKNSAEAWKFTVAGFIQGGNWLKSSGVEYTEGL